MAVYTGTDVSQITTGLANSLLSAMAVGTVPDGFAAGYMAALDSVCLAVGAESRFLLDQFGAGLPVEHYEPPQIGAPVIQVDAARNTCSSEIDPGMAAIQDYI